MSAMLMEITQLGGRMLQLRATVRAAQAGNVSFFTTPRAQTTCEAARLFLASQNGRFQEIVTQLSAADPAQLSNGFLKFWRLMQSDDFRAMGTLLSGPLFDPPKRMGRNSASLNLAADLPIPSPEELAIPQPDARHVQAFRMLAKWRPEMITATHMGSLKTQARRVINEGNRELIEQLAYSYGTTIQYGCEAVPIGAVEGLRILASHGPRDIAEKIFHSLWSVLLEYPDAAVRSTTANAIVKLLEEQTEWRTVCCHLLLTVISENGGTDATSPPGENGNGAVSPFFVSALYFDALLRQDPGQIKVLLEQISIFT